MSESPVFKFDGDDPAMQQAHENARASFRYFWREVAWERRRIIPALDLACVKAPFSDGEDAPRRDGVPNVEHMWLAEIDFDGETVSGVLLNEPNWITSVHEGDSVSLPLAQISDWMYAISGEVFGAYTVNLMRSRMSRSECRDHDAAWGIEFGDPHKIRVAPEPNSGGGLLKGWFGKKTPLSDEHPMSVAMAESLTKELAEQPEFISSSDDRGWTLLHHEALAGSVPTVKVLLAAGADPQAKTNQGQTPLMLAQSLGWENVVALLTASR
jgi:uncharacterized protein YegJ (DUF2314 family)